MRQQQTRQEALQPLLLHLLHLLMMLMRLGSQTVQQSLHPAYTASKNVSVHEEAYPFLAVAC